MKTLQQLKLASQSRFPLQTATDLSAQESLPASLVCSEMSDIEALERRVPHAYNIYISTQSPTMASITKQEDSQGELRRGEENVRFAETLPATETVSRQAKQDSTTTLLPESRLPSELILPIIERSINMSSRSPRINLSILLCCRLWLDLAVSVIWKHVRVDHSRIGAFLNSLTLYTVSARPNMSHIRSLSVTANQTALRELTKFVQSFIQLRHFSVAQLVTDQRAASEIIVDDMISKLSPSLQSLELVLPSLGSHKRCDHFCKTLAVVMRRLHSLRIYLRDWVMANTLERFKSVWIQKFPFLRQFVLVIPLGTSFMSSCCPRRQLQFLREMAIQLHQARGQGLLPELTLCTISAYCGKLQTFDSWRGDSWPDDRSTTFNAIRNRIFSYPLVRLSEKSHDLESKGLPGIFWTRMCIDDELPQAVSTVEQEEKKGGNPASGEVGSGRLVTVLGTIDDLMALWEGQECAIERHDEALAMLTEEEVKFVRDQEEDLDPVKMPRIDDLM